jgi:thymidylate kinase
LVLWAIVASADYAAWLQYVRWRLWRGDVVLADRYLCDFEVELGIRLRHEPHLAALLLRVLRSLAPTPQRAYLLQIDPALSRKRTTESGVGDLDPAAMQRRYDALTHRYGLRACDASRPLDDLAAELVHDALTTYVNTPTLKRWACDGGDNVRGAPRGLAGREPAVQPLHGATDSASEGRSPSHSA